VNLPQPGTRPQRIATPAAPIAGVASKRYQSCQPAPKALDPRSRPRVMNRRLSAVRARQGAWHDSHHSRFFAPAGSRDGIDKKGMELIRELDRMQPPQRYGVPRRRATRARRSASDPAPTTSMPLSIKPSMSARMISARFIALPFLARMSLVSRSRSWIWRSKRTTDTFDQVSLWTGGRPGPAFP
jgi:hypothetical protein